MIDVFFIIAALLIAHYIYLMLSINRGISNLQKNQNDTHPHLTFSIVIAARNEEQYIGKLLESLSQLNYPKNLYEVIIINDRSTDRTGEIIDSYLTTVNQLIHLQQNEVSSGLSPKKSALMKGIRSSKGEIILTTDADCIVPESWLTAMAAYYTDGTQVVAGPVTFIKYPNYRIFMNLQSLDFLSLVSMAAGAIGIKKPVICSGANFSYRKSAFESVGGYSGHLFIASGDDDLLLQSFAEKGMNINYAWNPAALVETHPVETVAGFIEQRKRWGSKAAKYNNSIWTKHFYIIFFFYMFLFSVLIGSFFSVNWFEFFCAVLLIKSLYELPIAFRVTRMTKSSRLLFFYPLLQIFVVPYLVISGVLANFGNYKWK